MIDYKTATYIDNLEYLKTFIGKKISIESKYI